MGRQPPLRPPGSATPLVLGYGFYRQGSAHPAVRRLIWLNCWAFFRSWFGGWPEWGRLVLTFLTLVVAVYSIEQAEWIQPRLPLTFNLGLAMLSTLLLLRRRLPAKVIVPLMTILGVAITVWQSASLIVPAKAVVVTNRLMTLPVWWQAIATSEGTIHFAVFLLLVTWTIGFVAAWFILRRQNAWMAVSLGATVILVNLSNLPKEHYYFFPIYFLAAALLLGLTNLARQYQWFTQYGSHYAQRGLLYFLAAVIGLSGLTVAGAWLMPEIKMNQPEPPLISDWTKQLEESWLNPFAAVPAKWGIVQSRQEETLSFASPLPLDQSEKILFVIASEQPAYWRTYRYDIYFSGEWVSSLATDQMLNAGTPVGEGRTLPSRQKLTYTVENRLKTDLLLTAGEFISSEMPVFLQTISPAKGLSRNNMRELLSAEARQTGATDALYLTNGTSTEITPGDQPTPSAVIHPPEISGDIISVITRGMLPPYQRYTLTASVSLATSTELRQAGVDYEEWVTADYLQLPNTLPRRVRQLSQKVNQEAKTPYEKAMAIQRFLRDFKYNLAAQPPPPENDGVDWFLFEEKEGWCTQFASAMVVMLRSVGVPARLAGGYRPGELDVASGNFIVRVRDAHTWPEVYFPSYGWIGFEPTPISPDESGLIGEEGTTGNRDYFYDDEDDEVYGPYPRSASGEATATPPGKRNTPAAIWGGSLLLILALALVSHYWLQRLRTVKSATEVYAKMSFLASLIQAGPNPEETPLEYCARLALMLPQRAEVIDTIAQAYVATRFSPRKELEMYQRGKLRKSWQRLYGVLLKRLLPWGK